MRAAVHIVLHLLVPGVVALVAFRPIWKKAWLIMVATMVIDADHLLATPVFDPGRCSIGFHPLHTWPAIAAYVILAAIPKTRLVGLGLVIHILLDGMDCVWMAGEGVANAPLNTSPVSND